MRVLSLRCVGICLSIAAVALSGCASHEERPSGGVTCYLESVSLGLPDGSLALPGTHRLDGWATVTCSSAASRAVTLEVALTSNTAQPIVLRPSGHETGPGVVFELFSDELLTAPLAEDENGVPSSLWEVEVPAQSHSFLNIPFFGRVYVPAVMPPGLYGAPSGLSLFTRLKS